jgi:hypothetical protein
VAKVFNINSGIVVAKVMIPLSASPSNRPLDDDPFSAFQ